MVASPNVGCFLRLYNSLIAANALSSPLYPIIRDLKKRGRRRQVKRRLKSKFAVFKSSSRLFQPFTLSNVCEPSRSWIPNSLIQIKREKKNLSLLVYILYKTLNSVVSRRSRAVTAKKCTKKRDVRAKLLFWRSRCRRRRPILRSLLSLGCRELIVIPSQLVPL